MLRRATAVHLVTLLALAILAQILLRATLGISLPIGLDIDLWGLETMNASAGLPTQLHPIFPLLSALLMRVTGIGHLDAAVWVSTVASILIPAATWGLALQFGATRHAAFTAGAVALLFPGVLAFGALVSADALTTLMLIGVASATAAYVRTPDLRRLGVLTLILALATVVREHGMVCAGLATVVVLFAPERHHQRVLGVAAIALAVFLAPLLAGLPPALPGAAPWSGRMLIPLMDILDQHDATLARFPVFGLTLGPFHTIAWALTGAPIAWTWVLLAYLALLRGDRVVRAALLVAVGPALVGLAVISQPRHVWVTVPVCAAVWLATRHTTSRARSFGWGSALVLLLLSQARWIAVSETGNGQRTWRVAFSVSTEIIRLQHNSVMRKQRSDALCAVASPNDLWSGDPSAITFCPLRQHRVSDTANAANLHCWYSGEKPPSDAWRQVQNPGFDMPLFRLLWQGSERSIPCAGSSPASTTFYRALPNLPATMEPPCEADEAWVTAAKAALGVKELPERRRDPSPPAPRQHP